MSEITEVFGNKDCVACEGGGWIVSFSSAANEFVPCPACNPNYENLDNRFYREKNPISETTKAGK